MSRRISLLGLVAMLMAARSQPAGAQVNSGSQDVQIYACEMFGDASRFPLSAGGPHAAAVTILRFTRAVGRTSQFAI